MKCIHNKFLLREANIKDIDIIADIMQTVFEEMLDKSLYVCKDRNYVQSRLTLYGFGVVAEIDNKIVGFLLCNYPEKEKNNLGIDIGLSDEELNKVVHMENAAVLKEYRGNGLEKELLKYAETLLDKHIKYSLTTISPYNIASCKSVENLDYKLMITKLKYGGLRRRIYCKYFNDIDNNEGI